MVTLPTPTHSILYTSIPQFCLGFNGLFFGPLQLPTQPLWSLELTLIQLLGGREREGNWGSRRKERQRLGLTGQGWHRTHEYQWASLYIVSLHTWQLSVVNNEKFIIAKQNLFLCLYLLNSFMTSQWALWTSTIKTLDFKLVCSNWNNKLRKCTTKNRKYKRKS